LENTIIKLLIYIPIIFILSGCGGLNKPSPDEINKNSKIRIFIDESASKDKADKFIDAYVNILNNGFKTTYTRNVVNCTAKETDKILIQDYKDFILVYDKGYVANCQSLPYNITPDINVTAKRISDNSVEIKTNGALEDIMYKHLTIQSLPLDERAFAKLIPYGYTNFNIDVQSLKKDKLILNLYPKYVEIKDMYTKTLKERGYVIVDNYDDADKVIYIENLAALPLNFAGGLIGYYEENGEGILKNEILGIKKAIKEHITAQNAPSNINRDIGSLATHYATGPRSSANLNAAIMGSMLVLDSMFGTKDKARTLVVYKLVVENKKSTKNASNDVDKYRYRAAIYYYGMYTSSSLSILKDKLNNGSNGYVDVKSDLITYFEDDDVKRKNEIIKADYDEINN